MSYAIALTLILVGGAFVYDGFNGRSLWSDVLTKVRTPAPKS